MGVNLAPLLEQQLHERVQQQVSFSFGGGTSDAAVEVEDRRNETCCTQDSVRRSAAHASASRMQEVTKRGHRSLNSEPVLSSHNGTTFLVADTRKSH